LFDRYSGDKKQVLGYYRAFLILSILGISGLGVLCSNIGIFVKNEDFTATLPYTLIFLSAFIFSAISNLYAMQITFSRKGSYYLWLSIIVLSINLTLNVLLIPANGIKGAVAANVATKAMLALAVIYFSQRALRVNSLRQTATLTGLFLATEYACWAIAEADWMSFRTAGIVQFIILVLFGALNYRKQILTYLPFQTSK
jgi:O-antigen/teichoic acid export membrane protein